MDNGEVARGEAPSQPGELLPFQPHADSVTVAPSALAAAREIDTSSGRRRATPVRKSFVRRDDGEHPPLARVYRGGRSGVVAVKLYLAVLWRCAAEPFATAKANRGWATLLGLPDPDGKGARRVAAAFKTLERERLITITPQAGQPSLVTLLDESGDGSAYGLPSTAYALAANADERQRNRYFKVNSELWTSGDIQSLSGPGVVLLLILLSELAGRGDEVWFSTDAFTARYGISHKPRSAGTSELLSRGLLRVDRRPLTADLAQSVFENRRYRSVYRLVSRAVTDAPVDVSLTLVGPPHGGS